MARKMSPRRWAVLSVKSTLRMTYLAYLALLGFRLESIDELVVDLMVDVNLEMSCGRKSSHTRLPAQQSCPEL